MEAHKIKEFREAKNLTQQQFGELLGVTPTTVTVWEKGQVPSGAALKLLQFLIDGIHPFNGSSGDNGANWDVKFSLQEWRELERRRIANGFAAVEDYLAWVVKQDLAQRPTSKSSGSKGRRGAE